MLKFIFYLYILLINNQIRFHLNSRPYRLFSSHNLSHNIISFLLVLLYNFIMIQDNLIYFCIIQCLRY